MYVITRTRSFSGSGGGCCGLGEDWVGLAAACKQQAEMLGLDPNKYCAGIPGKPMPDWYGEWLNSIQQMIDVTGADIKAQEVAKQDIAKLFAETSDPQALADELIKQGAPAELVRALALQSTKKAETGPIFTKTVIALSILAGVGAGAYGYWRGYGSVSRTVGYGAAGALTPALFKVFWRGAKA